MKLIGTLLATAVLAISLNTTFAQDVKEIKIKASVDCGSCKAKIEKKLTYEKGVTYVLADVETKIVTVKFKEDKNTSENLVKAVQKLGYGGELLKTDATNKAPAKSGCAKPCSPEKAKTCGGK